MPALTVGHLIHRVGRTLGGIGGAVLIGGDLIHRSLKLVESVLQLIHLLLLLPFHFLYSRAVTFFFIQVDRVLQAVSATILNIGEERMHTSRRSVIRRNHVKVCFMRRPISSSLIGILSTPFHDKILNKKITRRGGCSE